MPNDAKNGASSSSFGGGPKPVSSKDWLFGYAPRRQLLTRLFGPDEKKADVSAKGLSAAQIAALAGTGRSTAKPDVEALEALGLVRRVRIGKRDRFLPQTDSHLASSICLLLENIDRLDLSGS